jgi:hypothetical protein
MMRVAKMRCIAVAMLLLTIVVVGGAAICVGHATLAIARTPDPYAERTYADTYGREIVAVEVSGKPPAAKATAVNVPLPDIAAGINSLSDVPAFDWSYGCSATSAAMLFGYYDHRAGYSNMYAGPTNGGLCPLDNSIWGDTVYPGVTCHECPLSATHQGVDGLAIKGHVDDYWIDADNSGPDPYIGNWPEHAQGACTGDFMGTNQSKFGNVDGGTRFWYYTNGDPVYDYTGGEPAKIDGCHGMKDFAVSRGYAVVTNFNQYIKGQGSDPAKGFTFSQYVAEIDAGRPVLIQLEGHTMLGYGYNTTGNVVYIRNTWNHSSDQMTWGGTYYGMQHYGVTVIRLSYSVTITVETSGLVPSYPATVHYVQAGVPKTATTDGPWSDNVDYGSTVSIDNPVAVSSTERYGTNAETSWTATETATYTVPYYRQFKPTVSAVAAGTGHTDLSNTNYVTLNYYRFGAAGTFNVFDAQSFNDWVDTGSTTSLSSTSSASTLTHRWYAPETTSWTVNDASSHSVTYWDQFKPAISIVTAGTGHTDLDSTNSATLTYSRFGAAGTSSVFDGQSFNDWVDIGSIASLSSTSSASTSTHRCYAPGTASWAVNDATSRSATYWDQFKLAISTVTAGTGHTDLDSTNCATLTCSRFGAAGTSSVFDGQSFNDWVDTGSTASLSNPSSASTSTHRWYSLETTSWAVSDTSSRSATYWDQFKPAISVATAGTGHTDLNSTNFATLMCYRFGAAGTLSVFDAQSFNDWVDMGSTASLSNPSSGSTSTHRWYSSGTTSWAISDARSRSATYCEQFEIGIAGITGLASLRPTTITFTRNGATNSLTASDTWTDWADAGSTLSVTKSIEGGWIGDWSTGDTTDWTVDSPISASIRYHRSYVGLYVLIGGLLVGATIIGVGIFFLLRIRRKGYALRDLPGYLSDRLDL